MTFAFVGGVRSHEGRQRLIAGASVFRQALQEAIPFFLGTPERQQPPAAWPIQGRAPKPLARAWQAAPAPARRLAGCRCDWAEVTNLGAPVIPAQEEIQGVFTRQPGG